MAPLFSQHLLLASAGAAEIPISKGYLGGGWSSGGGGYRDWIDGFDFPSETSFGVTDALEWARSTLDGASKITKGYWAAGWNGIGYFYEIDGFIYDTEVVTLESLALDNDRYGIAAVTYAGGTKGYWGGGYSTFVESEIDGINMATEVAINPSATLNVARLEHCSVFSPDRGYWAGGMTDLSGTPSSEIDGIRFDTEAAINPSATLTEGARYGLSGTNSDTRGYFAAGRIVAGKFWEIDGIRFDTEAAIDPSVNLTTVRDGLASVQSLLKGYYTGGSNISNVTITEIDGIVFSSETLVNPSAVLNDGGRYSHAGIQPWKQI